MYLLEEILQQFSEPLKGKYIRAVVKQHMAGIPLDTFVEGIVVEEDGDRFWMWGHRNKFSFLREQVNITIIPEDKIPQGFKFMTGFGEDVAKPNPEFNDVWRHAKK